MVSVIIPTYKSWYLLAKCLDAIFLQSFEEEFEVVVVNNDTDDVPQEIKKYKHVVFLQELKEGSYAARNKGLEYAKGEIVVFTDADCVPDRDWLKNGIDKLMKTNAGVVGGDVRIFFKNPDKPTAAEVYDSYTGFDQEGYVKYGHCVTANWFSYKKVIDEFGGFNGELKSNGDSELSGKISKKYRIIYARDAIVWHPARYQISDIIMKNTRLIGGTYDRQYKSLRGKGFGKFVFRFIMRRLRFNLNIFRKGKFRDGIKIFQVHCKLFPALVSEYRNIMKTQSTQRR